MLRQKPFFTGDEFEVELQGPMKAGVKFEGSRFNLEYANREAG